MVKNYNALVVNKTDNTLSVGVETMKLRQLHEGEVLIEVHYSSVNYKDALACSVNGNIVKQYPHIPGIDLSGIVALSKDKRFKHGDEVIATSYNIGVSEPGGFSEYCIVHGDYIVPLPAPLSLREAMIVGTAGLTAASAIKKLKLNGLSESNAKVVVTGASGGVGSQAVAMLSSTGYEVVAMTRKATSHHYLYEIGATSIMSYDELNVEHIKSLDKQLWDGAIDAVGGNVLASIISKLKYGSSVASCGLTGGTLINTNVFPFLLRGVNLLGIDSVYMPMSERVANWDFIAQIMPNVNSDKLMMQEISLREIPSVIASTLKGENIGRYLVNVRRRFEYE